LKDGFVVREEPLTTQELKKAKDLIIARIETAKNTTKSEYILGHILWLALFISRAEVYNIDVSKKYEQVVDSLAQEKNYLDTFIKAYKAGIDIQKKTHQLHINDQYYINVAKMEYDNLKIDLIERMYPTEKEN
jgi:hypothetical protein